jgi:hypothetical protein
VISYTVRPVIAAAPRLDSAALPSRAGRRAPSASRL